MKFEYEYWYAYKPVYDGFSGWDYVPDPTTLRIVVVPSL